MNISLSSLLSIPGISPVARRELMSSRNPSDLISESVKMKETYPLCIATVSNRSLISSMRVFST
jgi:hypothetical protein